MLKIINNWELQDYLRNSQGRRGYGLPINPTHRLQQIGGAYYKTDETIVYFIARQLNNSNTVIVDYDLAVNLVAYSDGQILVDNTQFLNGILPEGYFFLEFNNGKNTYYTEIFAIKEFNELLLCSSGITDCSSSLSIATLYIDKSNLILLKTFEDSELYQFEQ